MDDVAQLEIDDEAPEAAWPVRFAAADPPPAPSTSAYVLEPTRAPSSSRGTPVPRDARMWPSPSLRPPAPSAAVPAVLQHASLQPPSEAAPAGSGGSCNPGPGASASAPRIPGPAGLLQRALAQGLPVTGLDSLRTGGTPSGAGGCASGACSGGLADHDFEAPAWATALRELGLSSFDGASCPQPELITGERGPPGELAQACCRQP
jgi:hypothetical protein